MSPLAVRAPVLAGTADDGGRFYRWGEPPELFWSVTTIISGGVPKYLVPWASKCVADLAYRDLAGRPPEGRVRPVMRAWAREGRRHVAARQAAGELRTIDLAKLSDEDLALRWLKGTPDRIRDAAGERGTLVHNEAEDFVLARAREAGRLVLAGERLPAWPDAIAGHMAGFVHFLEDYAPTYVAAEATVFNRAQAYAGTLDAVVDLDLPADVRARLGLPSWGTVRAIVDYKSGNDVYPEVGMQLAAYARGEFIGAPDGRTELPIPAADLGLVLHLLPKPTPKSPRGYRLRPVLIDDGVFRAFLFAREMFRWVTETSRDVLGEPLSIAAEEVA